MLWNISSLRSLSLRRAASTLLRCELLKESSGALVRVAYEAPLHASNSLCCVSPANALSQGV